MSALKWFGIGFGITALGAAAVYAQYRNIEEPAFTVVKTDTAFELRDYAPMVVAEVTHTGSQRRARGASFRRLAAYIFGQDRPEGGEEIAMTSPVLQDRPAAEPEKIAMTSPVLQDQPEADTWRMRFIMPAEYTLETLPKAPADITLTEVPARRMATVKFNGYAPADELSIMEGKLGEWVEAEGLEPVGAYEHAFYDAPMVPGPMRRNEVMVEVAAE
ncbi:MAG: heme-binding protein [Pseudomonadota bacterium]